MFLFLKTEINFWIFVSKIKQKEKCHQILLDRIDSETQYIFSNDSDFINKEMEKFLV